MLTEQNCDIAEPVVCIDREALSQHGSREYKQVRIEVYCYDDLFEAQYACQKEKRLCSTYANLKWEGLSNERGSRTGG